MNSFCNTVFVIVMQIKLVVVVVGRQVLDLVCCLVTSCSNHDPSNPMLQNLAVYIAVLKSPAISLKLRGKKEK